ncbi:MAG: metallophosphoesterase family protein [Candidatus Omnitrophica bacterium]|nr:metallophosphoesterase family protein [Candidatus Omnitrophota bacterium]
MIILDDRRIFVVGDLHGDLDAYNKILNEWEKENNTILLFLGDFADRGDFGVEIIESLIKIQNNKRVIILKGNHEDYNNDGTPNFNPCSFVKEATEKRGNWHGYFSNVIKPFFDKLDISAIIMNKILFIHGGISSKIHSLNDLINPTHDIITDILWSDPNEYIIDEQNNHRGCGVEFSEHVLTKVMKDLNVKLVIRSHQPNLAKKEPYIFRNKLVTISSTSIYGGKPHYLIVNPSDCSYECKYV